MEPAYVLHRWPYQDSSLLVELLSAEHGRYRVIAKGARQAKHRWRGLLQPFTPLLVASRGRHELQTLVSAESTAASWPLQRQWLFSGFYVNELIQRLTTFYQPLDGLFELYQETLAALAQESPMEPLLRQFEYQLLNLLGHGFAWHEDAQGAAIQPQCYYQWVGQQGLQLSQANDAIAGSVLLHIAQLDWQDPALWPPLKRLLRQALHVHLGPQPLRSRQLFQSLRPLGEG